MATSGEVAWSAGVLARALLSAVRRSDTPEERKRARNQLRMARRLPPPIGVRSWRNTIGLVKGTSRRFRPPTKVVLVIGPRSRWQRAADQVPSVDASPPFEQKVIYVRRTRDPIELGGEEEWQGLDIDESIAAFDDLVTERIAERFPDAEVILDEHPWSCDGFEDRAAIIDICRSIKDDVYCDEMDEWLVQEGDTRPANEDAPSTSWRMT